MGKYTLSDLTQGIRLSNDLFSESGELLLTRGITLSESHIKLLRKRNIFVVYTHDVVETSRKGDSPQSGVGTISSGPVSDRKLFDAIDEIEAIPIELPPEFQQIRSQSLKQLLYGAVVQDVEKELRRGFMADRPVGVGLKTALSQLLPADRNSRYKEEVVQVYVDSLHHLQRYSETILSGGSLDVSFVRDLVEQLLRILLKDRALLLSLSSVKVQSKAFVYNHSLNVCILSLNIATALGYNKRQIVLIGIGALLHDIGMFLVPDAIRNKNSALNDDEFAEVRKHPVTGLHLLGKIRHLPDPIRFMIYQSHEREDGSGYPRHSSGKRIHGYARIIQTADIFEALTSPRQYRGAYTPFEAMETLIKMTQEGKLALPMVRALLQYVSLFPVGSIVELSDHRLARIIQANTALPDRPIVSVLADERYELLCGGDDYQCDLSVHRDISIIRAFSASYLKDIDLLQGF